MSLFGIIRAITGVGGSVILAAGKPQLIAYVTSIQLAIMAGLIYPFSVRWNITGVSLIVFLVSLISLPAQYLIIKQVKLGWGKWLKTLSPPVIASVLMALVLMVLKYFLRTTSLVSLMFLIFLGMVIYSGLLYGLAKKRLIAFKGVLEKQWLI